MRATVLALVLLLLAPPSRIDELLGEKGAAELESAKGGIGKVEVLVRHREKLAGASIDRETGLALADSILEGLPWRDRYVDRVNQQDLFELKKLIVPNDLRALSWLWVRLLEHSHPYVRLHGTHRLAEMKTAEHAAAVAPLLADPDPRVRMGAASALVAFRATGYREGLVRLLADGDRHVRRHAASALAELSGRAAAPEIARALEDEDASVRGRAATVLEDLGARECLAALRRALEQEKREAVVSVIEGAVRSLEAQRGERRDVPLVWERHGPACKVEAPTCLRITATSKWTDLWGPKGIGAGAPPEIDLAKHMAIAVFLGRTWNSRGVSAVVTEDDETIRVRFDSISYQSMGGADRVSAYGIFVVPSSKKAVLLEENVQGLIGGEAIWKERARFPRR